MIEYLSAAVHGHYFIIILRFHQTLDIRIAAKSNNK